MNGLQTQQFLGIEGGAKINIQMPECGILPFSVPFVATSIRARHLCHLVACPPQSSQLLVVIG